MKSSTVSGSQHLQSTSNGPQKRSSDDSQVNQQERPIASKDTAITKYYCNKGGENVRNFFLELSKEEKEVEMDGEVIPLTLLDYIMCVSANRSTSTKKKGK